MARTFDGADDVIRFSIGGLSGQTAAGTWAAICRRTNDVNFHSILGLHNSGATNTHYFQITPTDNLVLGANGVGEATSAFTVTSADDWVVVAATKVSGTTTPRFHKLVCSTGAWTHSAGSGSFANGTGPGATGYAETSWQGGDLFQGDIAAIGVWSADMSDAQVESLAYSLTSWWQVAPAAVWLLDQSATTQAVPDLTGGGANQSSLTGTTVASSSVPVFGYGASPIVAVSVAAAPAATAPPAVPALRRRAHLLVR